LGFFITFKRGGGYQKPSYNRPNQIQPQPPRNVSYNPAQPENNNNINNNYVIKNIFKYYKKNFGFLLFR